LLLHNNLLTEWYVLGYWWFGGLALVTQPYLGEADKWAG